MVEKKEDFTYKSSETYEITINPCDQHQYVSRKARRFPVFMSESHKNISEALPQGIFKYQLVAEISMPHINVNRTSSYPRLHFHGTLTFKHKNSVAVFLALSLYKLSRWANITINEYRGKEWDEYIHKSRSVMRRMSLLWKTPYIITESQPLIIR